MWGKIAMAVESVEMKIQGLRFFLIPLYLLAFAGQSVAASKTLTIYHDADYSNHAASAESMYMGLQTALSEVDFTVQGYRLELLKKDHRGNSNRAKMHMQQFTTDKSALFVLGGLHSPPYIKYRDYINENGVLLLVPWAAGGPITRYEAGENWVFRLSIDDTKAGLRLVSYATDTLKCHNPHLLLEETPWGRSNQHTMSRAITKSYGRSPSTTWFNWNTKESHARIMLRDIIAQQADCILLVSNAVEGQVFSKALAEIKGAQPIALVSHWGITGGDFAQRVPHDIRKSVNLHFIQSCFSFVSSPQTPFTNQVFSHAQALFPNRLATPRDMPAPAGFIHAYDLGRLVIAALNQVVLTGDMTVDRANLRNALEHIEAPVQGLIKTYHTPFRPWSKQDADAHEALGLDDFCMAEYLEDGAINVFPAKGRSE